MTGTFTVKLPEVFDVVQRDRHFPKRFVLWVDRFYASQVQHRIKQHGGMTDRQYETIPVGPDRMAGVEAQYALPQTIGYWRQGHWRSRMAGISRLYCIHRQCADGVDAQQVHLVAR